MKRPPLVVDGPNFSTKILPQTHRESVDLFPRKSSELGASSRDSDCVSFGRVVTRRSVPAQARLHVPVFRKEG